MIKFGSGRTGSAGDEGGAGCGVLLLAIFLFLIALAVFLAWQRSPPDAPAPASTAKPKTLGDGS